MLAERSRSACVVVAPIDEKFAEAMKNVGALRKTNRAVVIDVTYLFAGITGEYSLSEFGEWMEAGYEPLKGQDAKGHFKIFYLQGRELRKIDRRFLWQDRVAVAFGLDTDSGRINSFNAGLQWLGGI